MEHRIAPALTAVQRAFLSHALLLLPALLPVLLPVPSLLGAAPSTQRCSRAADQFSFIGFISFISHFFNALDVSLVSSQVTADFKRRLEEDNSFY